MRGEGGGDAGGAAQRRLITRGNAVCARSLRAGRWYICAGEVVCSRVADHKGVVVGAASLPVCFHKVAYAVSTAIFLPSSRFSTDPSGRVKYDLGNSPL